MATTFDLGRLDRFWKAIGGSTPPDLDGGPRQGVPTTTEIRDRLALLEADWGLTVRDALLLRAVAFLYNDHHDEAHDLVQDLSCPEGCLLHAILHRREPDFWNAKYWFRRCADHAVYTRLTERMAMVPVTSPAIEALVRRLTLSGTVDPMAMVDECEAAIRRPESPESAFLREVQRLEFESIAHHLLA
jgi:hypothetical protein